MHRRVRVLIGFVAGVGVAQRAFAQAPSESPPANGDAVGDANVAAARVHFRNGVRLYGDGNYAGALAEFEAAYSLKATAASLQNAALCLKALYRYAQAAQTLDMLLERHGAELSDSERETVRTARDELAALLSAVRFALSPPDAKLTIDGRFVPATEASAGIQLDVGEHVVEASAPGYATLRKSVRVATGQQPTTMELSLRPVAGFLEVRSSDDHAVIAIDGQARAQRTWRGPATPGQHYVQIYKPGYRAFERDVAVELGKTVVVEGVPGPPRDADVAPESKRHAREKQPASGGGWYGLGALTAQRPTNQPNGFKAIAGGKDETSSGGGALGLRGGYRIWKAVALELMIDAGEVTVQKACDESAGKSPSSDCDAPALTRDYSVATFRIGPNLRIMSTSDRLRVVGTLGMGAVSHTFRLGETSAVGDGGKDRASDPYLLLELGGEMNLGHVLLGLGLSLFFDGGSDLSVNGRELYPEDSDGLGFIGLTIRGGVSQWAP